MAPLAIRGRGAVRDHEHIRIVGHVRVEPNLLRGHPVVFLLKAQVVGVQSRRVQQHGKDSPGRTALTSVQDVVLGRQSLEIDGVRKDHGLHHLTDEPVPQKHHGIAVPVGRIEGPEGKIAKLLRAGRREDQQPDNRRDLPRWSPGSSPPAEGAIFPSPGPPRIMLTMTAGSSWPHR